MGAATTQQAQLSVTGSQWIMKDIDERHVLHLQQKQGVSELVARVLALRDISVDEADDFLHPSLKAYLPDPYHLLDMDKAVQRIAHAIVDGQTIAVFGDYDVDGATSTSLLLRYFQQIGAHTLFHIPDRMTEGYGPNGPALERLKQRGADVCITVDCGTLAFEALEHAQKVGLDMVVIDHHLSSETMPPAHAVVNPNRLDQDSEHGYMAAVGVCFLFLVALNSYLKKKKYFDETPIPNLLTLLDIVALGTVCDVVPLIKANRAFVSQGLKVMKSRQNVGLAALADAAAITEEPGVYHLGYVLGPRINAGGRVGKSDLGTKLLTHADYHEAMEYAKQLDQYNAERKAIEQCVLDEAKLKAQALPEDIPMVMVAGNDWHPGVIGIVAGRIKEIYHKPTAVISIDDNGIGKASARSIAGIDLGSAIVAANQAEILEAGGGHAMAAGFTVKQEKIDQLHQFLNDRFAEGVKEHGLRTHKVSGYLSVSAVNEAIIAELATLGPYGMANPEPKFVLSNVVVTKSDVLGADHVRAFIADNHAGGTGGFIKAMAFRSMETPIGQTLLTHIGKPLDVLCRLKLNCWQGRTSVEVLVEDVKVC